MNSSALSFIYSPTLTSKHDYWKIHSFDCMDLGWQSNVSLLFNMLSRLVIAFLPKSKHLLISWLRSPSAVIWEPILAGLIPISTERRNEDGRTGEGATVSEPWTQVSYFCIAGHLHGSG